MKKMKCDSCDKEIERTEAFEHEGTTYCLECVVEHLKGEHSVGVSLEAEQQTSDTAELERDRAKYSSEAKRTHTYKTY